MSFGTRLLASAPWVPPFASHPGAIYGEFLAKTIRQFYLHGQCHARFAGATSYGYDLRDVAADASNIDRAFAHTTWVGLHRGRRTLPRETTHVRAWICYAILSDRLINVNLRVTVNDGTNPVDTANGVRQTESQIPRIDQIGNRNPRAGRGENPFSDRYQVYVDDVVVALANVSRTTPGRCLVTVDGYAVQASSSAQRRFQPFWVGAFAEIRY